MSATSSSLQALTASFSTLNLEGRRSQDVPVLEKAPAEVFDFAYLKSAGLVDDSALLSPTHKNCFLPNLTDHAYDALNHFFGDYNGCVRRIFDTIKKKLSEFALALPECAQWKKSGLLSRDPRLLGEELYRLLGAEQLLRTLTDCIGQKLDTPLISQSVRQDLTERTKKLPEVLTIRFYLPANMDAKTRHSLVQGLQQHLAVTHKNISDCFKVTDTTQLSGFSMLFDLQQTKQRINFVFVTQLQNEYVATCDAVQIVLPLEATQKPYLIDHGLGDQWSIDTTLKIVRIRAEGKFLSKVLFRYLKDDHQIAGKELEIFQREQLQNPTVNSLNLFCDSMTQDAKQQALLLIYRTACAASFFGHHELAKTFVQEQLKRYPESSGSVAKALQLVSQSAISAKELDLVQAFFSSLMPARSSHSLHFQNDLLTAFRTFKQHQELIQEQRWLVESYEPVYVPAACKEAFAQEDCATALGFFTHLLLQRHDYTATRQELLLRQFPHVLATATGILRDVILKEMKACYPSDIYAKAASPRFSLEWIESLLHHPSCELQRVGYDLLYALDGYVEEKKKWIGHLLSEPSGQVLRFILQLEAKATVNEMTQWMKSCTRKNYLFYQLLEKNPDKWLACCIKVDPQVVVGLWATAIGQGKALKNPARVFETIRPMALPRAETWSQEVQACYRFAAPTLTLKEHFAYIVHPMAVSLAPEKLKEAFCSQEPLTAQNKTHLRVMAKQIILSLVPKDLALALQVVDYHKSQCEEMVDDDVRRAIFAEYRKMTAFSQDVASWYLTRLAFFSPRFEPVEQIRILMAIAAQYPQSLERSLEAPVQQLAQRTMQLPEYEALQTLCETTKEKVREKNAVFASIFAPFLGKKKQKKAQAPVATGEMAQCKLLYKQGKKIAARDRLFALPATDVDARKMALDVISRELALVPPDPDDIVTSLLDHFVILDRAIWERLFTVHDTNFDIPAIQRALLVLYKHRSKPLTDEQKSLWQQVLSRPQWLCSAALAPIARDRAFVHEVLLDKTHPDKQKVLFGIVKAMVNVKEPLLLSVAHDWFYELDRDVERFLLGCGLLQNDADFQRSTNLLHEIAGYLEVLAVDEELLQVLSPESHLQKRVSKRTPQSNANLAHFVSVVTPRFEAWRSLIANVASAEAVEKTVKAIVEAGTKATDGMLMKVMKAYPLTMQEAMVPVLARRMVRIQQMNLPFAEKLKMFDDAYLWLKKLMEQGRDSVLTYVYSVFFVEEDRLPSRVSSHDMLRSDTLKEKTVVDLNNPFCQKTCPLFADHYPRLLQMALSSNDADCLTRVLDIDISISYFNTKECQDFFRAKVASYSKVFAELMMQHVAQFGWSASSVKFMQHHYYLLTKGALSGKELYPGVKEENCELLQFHITEERFYIGAYRRAHPGIPATSEMIAFQRPVVKKPVGELLPRENLYLQDLGLNLYVCFNLIKAMDKGSLQRARMLDYVAQNLRIIVECYPQDAQLPTYLLLYIFALDKEDPFYEAHAKIASNILRAAFLQKIVTKQTAAFKDWHDHLGKTEALFLAGPTDALDAIDAEIEELKQDPDFTLAKMIRIVPKITQWYESCCCEQYPRLLQTIKLFASIWRQHPHVLDMDLFWDTYEYLMIPSGHLIGVDRSPDGQKYAVDVVLALCDALLPIFKKGAATRVMLLINLVMKRAMRYGAFNGKYALFCKQMKRLIPLLLENPAILGVAQQQTFISFTYILGLPSLDPESDRQRVQLMHEWLVGLNANANRFTKELLLYIAKEVLSTQILEAMVAQESECLLLWLNLFESFDQEQKLMLKGTILTQLLPLKKLLGQDRWKQLQKRFPPFLQPAV